jgi:hypothetical protein
MYFNAWPSALHSLHDTTRQDKTNHKGRVLYAMGSFFLILPCFGRSDSRTAHPRGYRIVSYRTLCRSRDEGTTKLRFDSLLDFRMPNKSATVAASSAAVVVDVVAAAREVFDRKLHCSIVAVTSRQPIYSTCNSSLAS